MDEIRLSEWWAVLTNGEWFVGRRPTGTARKLESLQKLVFQFGMMETPKGLRPHVVALTYPWFTETLEIPEGALWTAVQALHGPPWANLIGSTEKLKLEERAKRSGLHLA
jgi:hypothetical protein